MDTELTDDSCNDCGFASSARSREETITVLRRAPELVDDALGADDGILLNERPDSQTWSKLEYVEHIREVFLHSRLICEQALATPDQTYEGAFPPAISEEEVTLERHLAHRSTSA